MSRTRARVPRRKACPETIEAKTVHEFKASAERVFDAWLDPIKVRSWVAQAVPGHAPFRYPENRDRRKGRRQVHLLGHARRWRGGAWGYYLEIDRPRKLVFSWFTSEEEEQENKSVVTLTIEPIAKGCRATIVHSMDERWAEYLKQTETAWGSMLRKIDMDFGNGR